MKFVASFLILVIANLSLADEPDVQVKTIKEGKNCDIKAKPGDYLKIHYTGRFDDENGEIFDTSYKRGHLYHFQLGAGQVIQGYERGVPGMCLGETRTLTVPSNLGYGDEGYPGIIPGKATLHFTVELVELEEGKLKTLHPGLKMDL